MDYLRAFPLTLLFLLLLQSAYSQIQVYKGHLRGNSNATAHSEIRSYKHLVPLYCHNSFETIQCFEKCTDHENVTRILESIIEWDDIARSTHDIIEIVLTLEKEERVRQQQANSLDFRPGRGMPCGNKCETDPLYWSCVEDCEDQDHTTLWTHHCFEHQYYEEASLHCNESEPDFLKDDDCQRCLVRASRDRLKHSCEIAYLPNTNLDASIATGENLCEVMSTCSGPGGGGGGEIDGTVKDCANLVVDNLEKMRLCVNDKIMHAQRECCYSDIMRNTTRCGSDDAKCDELCMKILAPRLCRDKCMQLRSESIVTCIKEHCEFYHTMEDSFCGHCDDTSAANSQVYLEFTRDKTCVDACGESISCVKACLPYGTAVGGTSPFPKYLTDNCHNSEFLEYFVEYVMKNRKKSYWPTSIRNADPEFISWTSYHTFPFECGTSCLYPEPPLSTLDIENLCVGNPFRKIDLLACVLLRKDAETGSSLRSDHIVGDPSFADCRNDPEYEITQAILYKMIFEYETTQMCSQKYCQRLGPPYDDPYYHPNAAANMRCQIYDCQQRGNSPYCKKDVNSNVIDLQNFGICRWKADFSKWETPYRLWSTYFNELHPAEIKHKLEYPDATEVLSQSMFEGKKAYYSFPYFVIIRSVCDDGYYSDQNYKYVAFGSSPVVEMGYIAITNREWPKNLFQGVFKTALIDLRKSDNDDDNLVPENPRKRLILANDGTIEEIGCPENICYPAFAAPLMFLSVPKFKLVVLDAETVSLLSQTIYVSQFHTRVAAGRGDIYDPGVRDPDTKVPLGVYSVPAHPGHLFPVQRSTFAVDSELNYHQSCIANDITDKLSNDYNQRKCPELEHILDDFDNPYAKNVFAPLDPEDIFRSQYTYGTAPTQAIAGFYDPKYIIIGDADMNLFEVVDWSKLLIRMEENETSYSCIQHEFFNREHEKPIYSQLDRTDFTYPVKFFRQRYAPKAYYTKHQSNKTNQDGTNKNKLQVADTAIFEAIGLEDRLLLITTKGLVSFYGHSNSTVYKDKAWTYFEGETLNKCFKIVRILPVAQPASDLIVGITYDYIVKNINEGPKAEKFQEVAQEIWVGKYTNPGESIQWREIKENPTESMYLDEPVGLQQNLMPALVPFKPDKDPGLPQSMRVANPRSQIEAICYKAYTRKINKYKETRDKVRLKDELGWCVAMDATPVQLTENSIQVLVRMRTIYNADDTKIYFYIVATHILNPLSSEVDWIIDTIIPRYPCIDEHREAVSHVTSFDERYFGKHQNGPVTVEGCHAAHEERLDFHVFLHGMLYPRAKSNHLFLYGSRLLQSTNNGRNFMILKGFPQKFHDFNGFDQPSSSGSTGSVIKKNRPVHRIIKMAFDDGGHYAFLTNKLELWMGSTGSIHQIRMRPSPLQTMVQMGLSQLRNIHDGVPFTLDFDSNNNLYEMVAIVSERGHVTKILKRYVKEWKLLRVKRLLEKFESTSVAMYHTRVKEQQLTEDLQKPFNYDTSKWATFCGYVSPSLRQNFSKVHSRTQGTLFPHPEQHLNWGKAHGEASLLAFQAIAFTLVWESYFETPTRFYAGRDKDPYVSWILNRKFAAFATMKTTLYSQERPPEEHSILIQPLKYKRIVKTRLHSDLLRRYYLDYNITAELEMEFSIRNDHAVLSTEFQEDQINSVELNVENSNGTIIQINTEKEIRAHQAAVLFLVRISVKRKTGISQTYPGENGIPVPITIHLIGAFGNCILNQPAGIIGDKIETVVLVGCPPNRDFVFDWNATLRSIKLRGDRIEEKKGLLAHGIGKDCHDNEYVCFFARSPATLYFEIFDETKQRHVPYTGKYIMRIVGGGRTRDKIRLYKQEEIDAFNIVGVSDASLIWNEWDPVSHKKKDNRMLQTLSTEGASSIKRDSRESILRSGVSVVAWVCHTLSPCARITPTDNFEVVFWFRVFVTNRGVDDDTLCLYEKEFDVMLYGFPPSPEFQLIATLGFCFILMGILYLLYLCNRQNAKLWGETKLGAKNWYFIIKDAIPKKLRYYELPLPEEPERHDRTKKFRTFDTDELGSHDDASLTSIEMASSDHDTPADISSSSTLINNSSNADSSHSQILPRTNRLHTTAKQIIYDQILTRRLNSIVERNKALRTNLIKKASVHQSKEDFEQEMNFQKQFGRTVSQESVFTPPMPKDRNRGIDSFL